MAAVQDLGLFFGQAFASNVGSNDLVFKYEDRYSQNKVYTGNIIKVIINSIPKVTAAGKAF
jgi:hypothetical protein